jgi:sulfur carrier protein ThiS
VFGFKKKKITVELCVHGPATGFLTSGQYQLKEGSRLKALLRQANHGGAPPPLTCMIEGQRVPPEHRLNEGETVTVFFLVAGG